MRYRTTLKCPRCRGTNVAVIDSRPTGETTRRRRKCNTCQHRFTTFEIDSQKLEFVLTVISRLDELAAIVTSLKTQIDGLKIGEKHGESHHR